MNITATSSEKFIRNFRNVESFLFVKLTEQYVFDTTTFPESLCFYDISVLNTNRGCTTSHDVRLFSILL
jgi:hypothetical protein